MQTQKATVTIEAADVLTLNTTPVQLIPATGVGNVILVDKIVGAIDWNTTPYEGDVDINFKYDLLAPADAGGTEVFSVIMGSLLVATVDEYYAIDGRGVLETPLFENQGISAQVNTGNPVAGDSDITFTVYYKVVTV